MQANNQLAKENAQSGDGYKQLLVEVLLRKAKGYDSCETTEEFAAVDGEMTLVKRKVVTKAVPPDLAAIKVLIEIDDGGRDVTKMTDEELRDEKMRLINLLKETE